MKVKSLGYNPNLGKEFMERHGASFVIAQPAKSAPALTEEQESSNQSEEEAEELADKRMMMGRVVQNVQLEARAKGKALGAISARQILEMADRGELDDIRSVESLRRYMKTSGD